MACVMDQVPNACGVANDTRDEAISLIPITNKEVRRHPSHKVNDAIVTWPPTYPNNIGVHVTIFYNSTCRHHVRASAHLYQSVSTVSVVVNPGNLLSRVKVV